MQSMKGQRFLLGRLGERLVKDGVLDDDQLREAIQRQKQVGGFLGEIIVSMGYLKAAEIKPYLEEWTGFPFVDIVEEEIDRDLVALVPKATVISRLALPYREIDGRIHVAMQDPLDIETIDEYRATLNKPIVACLALGGDLNEALKRSFDD